MNTQEEMRLMSPTNLTLSEATLSMPARDDYRRAESKTPRRSAESTRSLAVCALVLPQMFGGALAFGQPGSQTLSSPDSQKTSQTDEPPQTPTRALTGRFDNPDQLQRSIGHGSFSFFNEDRQLRRLFIDFNGSDAFIESPFAFVPNSVRQEGYDGRRSVLRDVTPLQNGIVEANLKIILETPGSVEERKRLIRDGAAAYITTNQIKDFTPQQAPLVHAVVFVARPNTGELYAAFTSESLRGEHSLTIPLKLGESEWNSLLEGTDKGEAGIFVTHITRSDRAAVGKLKQEVTQQSVTKALTRLTSEQQEGAVLISVKEREQFEFALRHQLVSMLEVRSTHPQHVSMLLDLVHNNAFVEGLFSVDRTAYNSLTPTQRAALDQHLEPHRTFKSRADAESNVKTDTREHERSVGVSHGAKAGVNLGVVSGGSSTNVSVNDRDLQRTEEQQAESTETTEWQEGQKAHEIGIYRFNSAVLSQVMTQVATILFLSENTEYLRTPFISFDWTTERLEEGIAEYRDRITDKERIAALEEKNIILQTSLDTTKNERDAAIALAAARQKSIDEQNAAIATLKHEVEKWQARFRGR
jgi:hypothetical protein